MKRVHDGARAARGFTLIELVAGLSIALMVLGSTFQMYLLVRSQTVKTRVTAEMKRNARNALATMTRFLKMAGSGMPAPASRNGDPDAYPNGNIPYSGGTPSTIGPPIIRGNSDGIAAVGDFPRPDSNLNGLSVPAHAEGYQRYAYASAADGACPRARRNELEAGGSADATNHLTLLNELSGGCLAGSGCSTALASILLPGVGSACNSGNLGAPTCPWALKKYRPSEYVVLVYPSRRWLQRQLNNPSFSTCCSGEDTTIHTHCTESGQYEGLSFFYENWGGNSAAGGGGRNIPNTMGAGWVTEGKAVSTMVFPSNRGWVATLERVFFRFNSGAKSLEFNMCWGPLARGHASWADIDAANPCSLGATGSGIGGTAAIGGTGWQTLAKSVESVEFEYFDTADNEITTPPGTAEATLATVSRIGVSVTLSRKVGNSTIKASESTSIQLRSRKF